MAVLKSIIPRFENSNKLWDYGFQFCHNPTVCMNIMQKMSYSQQEQNLLNCVIMCTLGTTFQNFEIQTALSRYCTAVSSEGRTTLPESSSRPLPAKRPNHAT